MNKVMELTKYKKFLKDDNFVHCTICGNFRNSNSFSHRKSKDHQKKLAFKLRKIAFHLSQKKKKEVIVHDELWQERDCKRFCHFCSDSYLEHQQEGEFIIENLGSLYHHANCLHANSVKAFLERNFSEQKVEKYCILKPDLDRFLEKLSEAKNKYLKKMNILNNMILKQMKDSEEKRKNLIQASLVQSPLCNYQEQDSVQTNTCLDNSYKYQPMPNSSKKRDDIKVPPWLEDIPNESSTLGNASTAPVIGPTMDTLMKHVANQKKKGLSKNRVGANFKHISQGSTKWLPSFQGVWNQGRRKQLQIQFKRKNLKFKF